MIQSRLLAVLFGLNAAVWGASAAPPPQEACPADGAPACAAGVDWPGEFFPGVRRIVYEGPQSKNTLAFKWYNESEVVMGKPMGEWLRFSLAYWHTMRGDGSDPFGSPTKEWSWESAVNLGDMGLARRRLHAFFELASKLGVRYWCFHDRDVAPEAATLEESNAALRVLAADAKRLQEQNNMGLLWGTAQLFKHRRYMHGAATSPNASVFAYAAAQVKEAMEVTHSLGGLGYVFWGGREGYSSLLNTDMGKEQANLARFLRMAAKHAKRIKFKGQLMLEPKPQPAKHQYDFDAATTHAFLLRHGLAGDYKLNIECNHATLAGHSCYHELVYASQEGLLASLDANSGDPQVGWDTDEFLTDPQTAALVASVILRQGGLPVGVNFDAKLRRESTDPEDLFIAHIGGMDALARGLRNAAAMLQDGRLDALRSGRYSSYQDTQLGRDIVKEKVGFEELSKYALSHPDPSQGISSGKQELFEMLFNSYLK